MVYRDLIEAEKKARKKDNGCNTVDHLTGISEGGLGINEFLESFSLCISGRKWGPHMRMFGAFDIPFSSQGMQQCSFKVETCYATDPLSTFNPHVRWASSWTTALTPPGAITHTHFDGFGCSQYMVHFWGKKLWLFWPPTDKNLAIYGPLHLQAPLWDRTESCVQQMEGLQVLYLDEEPTAFVVGPNTLHAVISITECAHAGIPFSSYSHFQESARIMNWFVKWAGNFSWHGNTASEGAECMERLRSEGFDPWIAIVDANGDDERTQVIKSQLDKIGEEVAHLLKVLSGDNHQGVKRKRRHASP
jgi:hypothetical protein